MTVRFFGGWDFETRDAQSRNPATVGYAKGSSDVKMTTQERVYTSPIGSTP
jgi:hypothetical protein